MAKLAPLIILSTFLFAADLRAEGTVLQSKQVPTSMFNSSDIWLTEIFIDVDKNTFVRIMAPGRNPYGIHFLHSNNAWISLEQFGELWNAFMKDGHFHLACKKDETISIYKVRNGIELVDSIAVKGPFGTRMTIEDVDRVIPVTETSHSYYLLADGSCFPVKPLEFLFDFFSAGHGIYYSKPFLIEVEDGKLAKPRKLRYGGKVDESYSIKQVRQYDDDLVHFLGFRSQEERAWGPEKREFKPVILHHAAYNLKKKKVLKTHAIYKNTPEVEKDKNSETLYGPLSIDALHNDVYVVFSWIQHRLQPRPIPVNDVKSTIFYWQYNAGVSGDVEEIADGFVPLVKVDSSGNVHIFWINKNASLVHKVKKKGVWGKDRILVDRVDLMSSVAYGKYIAAEFDNDDKLHVVYPSGGTLVHSVLKVD